MDNFEDIYNKALELLESGKSAGEVLLEFAEYKDQLAPLLEISETLFAMPKNQVPEPARQRKYALAPSKTFWLAWIHVSKLAAVSMSLMLILSATAVAGYATIKSGPGQALFKIKKLAEQSQSLLAFNENQKADIQIAITQKRLSEAQEILKNPSAGNLQQEQAALSELADQTTSAVASVDAAAKTNPKTSGPLLSSLKNIADQQQNLLTSLKPDVALKAAANSALLSLSQTSEQISQLQESTAATGTDQTLAQLTANPDSVVVLGNLTSITKTQITVEKTTFTFNAQTKIEDNSGNPVKAESLLINTKVNIIGIKSQNSLLAQEILETSAAAGQGEVKGAVTSTQDITATGTASSTLTTIKKSPTENSGPKSTASAAPAPDPNTASASFIMEPPDAQYIDVQ